MRSKCFITKPALRALFYRHVTPSPKVPEWERIAQEMRLVAERVIRGGVPIDKALRDFDAKTDEILAKRRALLAARNAK